MEHKEFSSRRIPILFFANKMDLANALTPVECMEQLELEKLPGKSWHIAYVEKLNARTGRVSLFLTHPRSHAEQATPSQAAASRKGSRGSPTSSPRASPESSLSSWIAITLTSRGVLLTTTSSYATLALLPITHRAAVASKRAGRAVKSQEYILRPFQTNDIRYGRTSVHLAPNRQVCSNASPATSSVRPAPWAARWRLCCWPWEQAGRA